MLSSSDEADQPYKCICGKIYQVSRPFTKHQNSCTRVKERSKTKNKLAQKFFSPTKSLRSLVPSKRPKPGRSDEDSSDSSREARCSKNPRRIGIHRTSSPPLRPPTFSPPSNPFATPDEPWVTSPVAELDLPTQRICQPSRRVRETLAQALPEGPVELDPSPDPSPSTTPKATDASG